MVMAGPLATLKVDLVITSTNNGNSQLFVAASDEVFSEVHTDVAPIIQGNNSFSFRLRLPRPWETVQVRWDPLDQPADILVSDATLQVGFVRTSLGANNFVTSVDTSEVQESREAVFFSTLSNDGQILIIDKYADLIDGLKIFALIAGLLGASLFTIFVMLCARCTENVRSLIGLTNKFAVLGCNLHTASIGAMLATGVFLISWFWQI